MCFSICPFILFDDPYTHTASAQECSLIVVLSCNWSLNKRGISCHRCGRHRQGIVGTSLGKSIGWPRGIYEVPQRPRFSDAPRDPSSRRTPLSITDTILSSKELKMSQLFSNNIGSLNTTNINFTVTGDRSNILAWLSPLDPRSRHKDIQGRRVENVGEWILQTEEFRGWYASREGASDNTILFCYGDPGVGKTYVR